MPSSGGQLEPPDAQVRPGFELDGSCLNDQLTAYGNRQSYLHDCPAEKADANHKEPAGDCAEAKNEISKWDIEPVFRKPTIRRVKCALVSGNFLVGLLGMNLIDCLRSNSCRIQIDDMERRGSALFPNLSLWHLEVPNGGSTGRPDRTEDSFLLAVHGSKMGGGRIRRKQKHGFLASESQQVTLFITKAFLFPTLNALSARPQRPKQVLFPPVTNTSHS